jgi:hypothetical protein
VQPQATDLVPRELWSTWWSAGLISNVILRIRLGMCTGGASIRSGCGRGPRRQGELQAQGAPLGVADDVDLPSPSATMSSRQSAASRTTDPGPWTGLLPA